MTQLTVTTTLRESLASIAQGICTIWEADVDTPAVYAEQCRIQNADLGHSVMAHLPDGQFVGIGILCRRHERGFVLDFGIAPNYRGKGWGHRVFEALVGQIRVSGLHDVTLLVSTDNEAAVKIYSRAGFCRTRDMVTLRGRPAAYSSGITQELNTDFSRTVVSWFEDGKAAQPQWERELAPLLAMADTRAFENSRGFLLARRTPYFRQVEIVHLGLDPEARVDDLNGLLQAASDVFGPDLPLALPEEPANSRSHHLLHEIGFRIVERSYEMRLLL